MEDFVTYDIAVKLKEKGFKEQCLAYYSKDSDFYYNTSYGLDGDVFKSFNSRPNHICGKRIDAPIISQVLKWLREVFHIHFEVVGAAYGYNLIISDTPDKGGTDRYYSYARNDGPNDGGAWDSFEDCVNYGIEYVINNLI